MHGVCALNMELVSVLDSEPIYQFTSAGCSGNKILTPGLDETQTDVIVGPSLLGSRLKQKHHGISDNLISFSEANLGYRSIVNYAKLHLKEH
ncbi:expressed protein [Echinococcus multilocularis]|uniref:Expressed protein n=1 Tax=Echinococcus multilocularis TaxID=6211 RepID=A0A068YAU1_ECHMU|nr:expressed protein [Echinococcus multilocularis]